MWRRVGALVAAVGLGVWARCANWRSVFGPWGVELVPSDSHYYLRFALLQLRTFPRFSAFDSYVNFPTGAFIYWPPLHTWIVAAAVGLAGVARAEMAAAWVDPVVSAVELGCLGLLAWRCNGWRSSLATVLLFGLIPAAVESGALGNADHHVHEGFLVALAALAAGHVLATGSTRAAAWTGVALAAGRLLTPSAFTVIPCVALAWPLCAVLSRSGRPPGANLETGWAAALACAGALFLEALLFGRRTLEYEQLSFFHPLLTVGAFGACLGALELSKRRRAAALCFAVSVVAVALLVPELLRGWAQMTRVDPVLAFVDESKPLAGDPAWALALLGVALPALPLALIGALRRSRAGDPRAVPALVAGVVFLGAAAAQARFAQALSGACAVLIPLGAARVLTAQASATLRRASFAVAALGLASLLGSAIPPPVESIPEIVERAGPTLKWIRKNLPPASADPYGSTAPSYGIASHPLLGHLILWWGERPVLATMFSQATAHLAGIALNAQLLSSEDDEEAYQRSRHAGARYVVVFPANALIGAEHFDPHRSLWGRLLESAGIDAADSTKTTAHFRLVHESAETRRQADRGSYVRIFESVPGAVLAGEAAPGATVVARTDVRSDQGRTLTYERKTVADAAGHFALRVAYPCDGIGAAGSYGIRVADGPATAACPTETDIERGSSVDVH